MRILSPTIPLLTLLSLCISTTVRSQTRFVFQDDFTDNKNTWYEGNTKDYKLKVEYGHYLFESKKQKTWIMTKSTSIDPNGNFSIETSMRKVSGENNNALGLIWGYQDANNCYMFGVSGDGRFLYGKWENGTWTDLHAWTTSSFINGKNASNKLAVEKRGSDVFFYVNDQNVYQAVFEMPPGAQIGFAICTEAKAEFDYLYVKQIPGGTPILQERFADNVNKWVQESDKSKYMAIENGKYVFEHKRKENTWLSWISASINSNEDFLIETNMKKISGVDNYAYGVMWGSSDVDNLYYFGVTGTGYYQYGKFQGGNWTNIVPWATSDRINKDNAANLLGVKKEGNQYQFYINGEYVSSAPFESFYGNHVGFLLNMNMKVDIEDLMVTQLAHEASSGQQNYQQNISDDVGKFWDDAEGAFKNGQFTEALGLYQQVLVLDEKSGNIAGKADALGGIGKSYYNLNQLDLAKQFCYESIATGQALATPYVFLIKIFLENENDLGQAESICSQGLVAYPSDYDIMQVAYRVFKRRGMDAYNAQSFSEAIGYFSRAVQYDQSDALIYMCLGFSYYSVQSFPDCVQALERALNLDPGLGNQYPAIYDALNNAKNAH